MQEQFIKKRICWAIKSEHSGINRWPTINVCFIGFRKNQRNQTKIHLKVFNSFIKDEEL